MDASSGPDELYVTTNSRLLPTTFDPPKLRNGRLKILEPHGRRRRPKSGDFKLLAAYVAAYVGTLIPKEDYQRFIDPRGEKEWKRTIRAACDIEWRVGDVREFDDIPTLDYNVMSEYVARAWPLTRYFDGLWLIKWALRTTWTNRKKAAVRAEKAIEKQRRALDGISAPSDDDSQLAHLQTRRSRASKLGQSLYCVGGCQRMLILEHFPNNHVGICKTCNNNRQVASPSSQLQTGSLRAREGTTATNEQSSQEQPLQSARRRGHNPVAPHLSYVVGGPSNSHRRRNPHAALPGSVTTYSDAGQYPSGRSTYGITKPSQRGPRRRTELDALPVFAHISRNRQLPRDKAMNDKIRELDQLWQSLSQFEHDEVLQDLRQRREAARTQDIQPAQEDKQDGASQLSPESEDEQSVAETTLYPVTAAISRCIEDICSSWNVPDIAHIFPNALWPKPGTLWHIGVLKIFHTMAQEYPDIESRKGISTKFAELVKKRRERSNAKSQWSIVDARTTYAWAREQYGVHSAFNQDNKEYDNATGVRSSRRQRQPSGKASLSQGGDKGKRKITGDIDLQKKVSKTIVISSSSGLSEVDSDFYSDGD